MNDKELIRSALEALESCSGAPHWETLQPVVTALRKALANEALDKKAENARELGLDYEPAQQEPVALKWQQSPIRTAWGDDMVVASVAIDKDHTLSLYCERDQAPKVEAMFAQRTWVVPDFLTAYDPETPEYRNGWNDCRQLMLEMHRKEIK